VEEGEERRIRRKISSTMAGRLTNTASRILGGNGVVYRSVASSLRLRSGMGLPVGKHYVPDKPVYFAKLILFDFLFFCKNLKINISFEFGAFSFP